MTIASLTMRLGRVPERFRAVLATVAVAVVLLVVVPAILPHKAPAGLVLQGVELGAVNGLLAIGLVLTYRATRVINFSYGAMGSVAGTLGVMLDLGHHLNWFVCIVIALAAGAVVGALTEILVVRPFFNAPRIMLTVATIGQASALGGIAFLMPGWLHGPPFVGGVHTPLSGAHVRISPVIFNGDDLLIACAVPVVLAVLGWFLLRTDAGVAVRSMSDNVERARLLGIPVRRLSTLVWTIAGVLAALTVMLNAPSQGLTISIAAGPALLLPALAAFVIARMESLPIAFGSAALLGVITSVVQFNVSKEATTTVVNLAVILGALLLQRRRSSRADDIGGSWQATAALKPIPETLRRLPEVVAGRAVLGLVVLGLVVGLPFVVGLGTTKTFTYTICYGIVAVSLVLLTGWSGNVSLGQFALAGVGGVAAGDLVSKYNVDLFFSLAAAGIVGGLVALLVGLPALRIRGLNLAVTTMALAVAADGFFFNQTNFEHQLPASIVQPVLWKRFDLTSVRAYYFFCLAVLLLVIVFVKGLRLARAGRTFIATNDNERAAGAMAVPTIRVKLVGFMLAGVIAGVGGGLYVVALGAVGRGTFNVGMSFLVFIMAVIGGLGSISGALLGVAVIEVLLHVFPSYYYIITGGGLVLVLSFMPGGFGFALNQVRDRLLRVVAERRNLHVPSLVADRRVELTEHAPHEEQLMAAALSDGDGSVGESDGEVAAAQRRGELPTGELPAVPAEASTHVGAGTNGDGYGPPPLLRTRRVEVSYGPVQVLFGVDLDVHEGEIVALLGTNGAGKSTLLKGVSGLVKVAEGLVEYEGKAVTNTAPEQMALRGIGLMPGGRGVFPTLTVEENLRLGTWLIRKDHARVAVARRQVLELFPILTHRLHSQAGNLSGGEQQMLSLALALMVKPKVLMIDELSLGLAPTIVSQLLEVVRMLHSQGTTIVVVEQSVNVALEIAASAAPRRSCSTGPTSCARCSSPGPAR
jgi:branched-chain amino acid transport system permease protein